MQSSDEEHFRSEAKTSQWDALMSRSLQLQLIISSQNACASTHSSTNVIVIIISVHSY